jgi:hypothetical protein
MEKFTHAWLAFMAIRRLEKRKKDLSSDVDKQFADSLIEWFRSHRDGVISGAWYPDDLINDKADRHVLKFRPAENESPETIVYLASKIRELPPKYLMYPLGEKSPVRNVPFAVVDKKDNLPNRCESLGESFVDQRKVQYDQDKGSPCTPTDNQVALWLFMLSHYVADAHVPPHCDERQFSSPPKIHAKMEDVWDKEIRKYCSLDDDKERFIYDRDLYPALKEGNGLSEKYKSSFLKKVVDELDSREFSSQFGPGNENVWDFMDAICHRSYLISYRFFPRRFKQPDVTTANWQSIAEPALTMDDLSMAVLTDAVDSIARVWFRLWCRCEKWIAGEEQKRKEEEAKANKLPVSG